MNHEYIVCYIGNVGRATDVAFTEKCFGFARVTDEVQMDVQFLCHCRKPLDNSRLHIVFVQCAGGKIQRHQVINDGNRCAVLFDPVIDRIQHHFPVRSEVVVINGEHTGKHCVQLLFDARLQAIVAAAQLISLNILWPCCLEQNPLADAGCSHLP